MSHTFFVVLCWLQMHCMLFNLVDTNHTILIAVNSTNLKNLCQNKEGQGAALWLQSENI